MNSDERYMRRALQLARQGAGHAAPNPLVGAVIVHGDRIIGEGFHRRYGEAHAEVNAINSVAHDDLPLLEQSTIYVTLEPCCHYGKTPPCAKLLIEKRLRRVVIGTRDPFVKVAGKGIEMLRQAGINVSVGVLQQECENLNERFFAAHLRQRPWVMLKWAESSDRFIAPLRGRATFSTPVTMRLMHRERSRCDAILIGAGTATADNPSLTTRHWSGNSPLRILLDERLSTHPAAKLLSDGKPTLVYNGQRDGQSGNVKFIKLDDCHNLERILEELYQRGVTSLMVEGGADILRQFIDKGLWDECRVETAKSPLGTGIKAADCIF